VTPRALFICGSLNQTKQMHAVARELPEFDAGFTPFYGDRTVEGMRRLGLIEGTIGGNKRRSVCLVYLAAQRLRLDMHGLRGGYDLVVTCTDLLIPRNVTGVPLVVVQEGILEKDNAISALCRRAKWLPRWLAGSSLTGESLLYDRFCVASEGYRERLIRRGAAPDRVIVTGIPNFDDCESYRSNDFPHRGFVLACTSDLRETFQYDDRSSFIRRALALAAGRTLIFKLHPNENVARARREISRLAPGARIYTHGSAEEMIANCSVLITQTSSTVFVGMALGKEVHSDFPPAELRRLLPWQNGGTSGARIAAVCRDLLGLEPRRASTTAFSGLEKALPWQHP